MIQAHNPEQEEAEEELEVQYSGEDIEIGFNVNYLLDALSAVDRRRGDAVSTGRELELPHSSAGQRRLQVCCYAYAPLGGRAQPSGHK